MPSVAARSNGWHCLDIPNNRTHKAIIEKNPQLTTNPPQWSVLETILKHT
jgi:hypothetical protein